MSPAENPPGSAAGYTLLEVVIVVTIMAGMSFLLNEALRTTQKTDSFLDAAARAGDRGQNVIYHVTGLVSESRHLYENDEVGLAYLEACEIAGAHVAPGARLPVIDTEQDIRVDADEDLRTGNMLLFVREVNASLCVSDPKEAKQRWIDTYRMVAIYPSVVARQLRIGKAHSRDLVIWRSVPFPSHAQLMEIGDPKVRATVIEDLVDRYGFTHAWEPSTSVDGAFYALNGSGDMSATPEVNFTLEEDEDLSEGGRLVYANVQLAETNTENALQGSILAAANAAGWVPNGFEVKIGGPSGSRKVWIHGVFEAVASDGKTAAMRAFTTMAHARDF